MSPISTCSCDNCDWEGITDDLHSIKDMETRLDPGGEVPAGQCPKCGSLAYLVDSDWVRAEGRRKILLRTVGAVAEIKIDGDADYLPQTPEDTAATLRSAVELARETCKQLRGGH